MKRLLRRHPVAASVAVAVLLAASAVALAPWWIDLGPVRAKIQGAASSALAATVTYERMDLSWFPRVEVVVRSLKVVAQGTVQGAVRTVRVSPALLPLLRGKVVLTKIAVDGLDLGVTLNAPKDEERSAAPPGSDWTPSLRSLGSRTLDVELSRSRVVLSRPAGKSLTFEGIRLEAALRVAEGRLDVALSRLSAESPKFALAGTLLADAAGPRVEATARGGSLDVTDVRRRLLSFAGDDPTVASIFSIVRGGTLTSFSFVSSGKSPGDLGALERMSIRAAVTDAWVRIDAPGLDVEGVSADVALEGGVLSAENAVARVGKSRAEGGKVLVGLAKGDDRLRVEAQVRADLAEIPAILSRVIPSRTFHEEVALVEDLAGSATARLMIGDLKSAPKTSVAVSDMRFSANYRRLPWPIEVRGGQFSFDGKDVGVSGLSGTLGRSTFSGVAARVRLGRSALLESASGSLDVSLENFLEGARSIPGAASLVKDVRHLGGSVHVDLRRLAGPLARLDEASVDASGTFEEILLESSSSLSLPPLSIVSGGFAVSDDAIRVTDAEVRAMDASLRVSGVLSGYRHGERKIEATVEGELGSDAVRWSWERASLPAEFRPAAPVALGGVRVSFAGGGAFTAAGDFVVANGPRLTLDLAQGGGTTDVRDLTIADGDTRADMALRRQGSELDLRFKGRLDGATLAKIFGERAWHGGAIEGDLAAHVPLETPARLTADGALTATGFEVPTPAGPLTLERLDLRAAKNRFDVASSSIVLDEQRLTVAGSATLRDEAIVLDMDVATGDLPWARVEKVLGRVAAAKKKENAAPAAPLAIGGALRVSLASFSYGDFVWRPVNAELAFGRKAFEAKLLESNLCGISTTGEARVLPGGNVALEARVDAQGPDIGVPLTCLGIDAARMTGAYEASLLVKGEGPASGLPNVVRGPLTFKAEKGRIGKANVLTKILGVLNATDVFKGESRTRVGDAIPYDSLIADAELAEGRVSIRQAALKAPSITMAASGTIGLRDGSLDLLVLAHPLSTLDKVVQSVPVVRRILGRDFLAVGVKVTGSLDDPKAGVSPAKDIGKGLVGILERTVTLPVKVFDPTSPDRP